MPPAEGDGPQQSHQAGRRRQDNPLGESALEKAAIHVERGAQELVAGNEQHHEVGRARKLAPVGFGGELSNALLDVGRVALQMARAGGLVGGVDSAQVGVERCLDVDDDLASGRQVHDHIRPQPAFGSARLRLLEKVAVLDHAGQLDEAPQRQLAPLTAHLGPAQRLHQVARLAVQGALCLHHHLELSAEHALRLAPRLLELRDLLLGPVQRLAQRRHQAFHGALAHLELTLGLHVKPLQGLMSEIEERLTVLLQRFAGKRGESALHVLEAIPHRRALVVEPRLEHGDAPLSARVRDQPADTEGYRRHRGQQHRQRGVELDAEQRVAHGRCRRRPASPRPAAGVTTSRAGANAMGNVVDVDTGAQAETPRQRVVVQAGQRTQLEACATGPGVELRGTYETGVVVGAAGQQPEHVLGADDGEQPGLGVAVDGGEVDRSLRSGETRAGRHGGARIGHVLEQLHTGDDIEAACVLRRKPLGAGVAVVNHEPALFEMQARDLERRRCDVDPRDVRARSRHRLAEQAAAAADVEHTQARERRSLCDVGEAQRIDLVQHPELTRRVPPARRQLFELGDLGLIDVGSRHRGHRTGLGRWVGGAAGRAIRWQFCGAIRVPAQSGLPRRG